MEDLPTFPCHYSTILKLLEDIDPKPVIALDLDYTIWPSNCFEMTAPPYETSMKCTKSEFTDTMGRNDVIYCTDKRTDSIRPFSMYPETRQVLEFCAEHNLVLTICSRSPDILVVQQIMEAFGIWEWFLFPQVYYKRKTFHFRNLREATGFEMRDFLFFDDEPANITMCGGMGVNTCLVDKKTGLNWSTFTEGLRLYKTNMLCRKSFANWIEAGEELLDTETGEDTDESATVTTS